MMFTVREHEREAALAWAKNHQVEVTLSEDILDIETVEQLKGFDGVTSQQTGKLDDGVYERLSERE